MEKLFKRLFLYVILHFLLSCVATEVSDVANCPANEKFDPVKRICVSSVLYSVPPVGVLNSVSMLEDGLPLDVVLEYSDVDGNLATSCAIASLSVGVDTSDGTCVCMGGVCRTTLIQTPNFSGFTEFYYTITDVNGVSQPKSVLVEVVPTNDAPTASDVSLSVNEDITLTSSLFTYGSDPDLDSLSFIKVSDPLNGSITFWDMNSGNFTYVPGADDSGTYTFLYKVCDNGTPTLCSNNYTVTVLVIPVDDGPIATSVSATLTEGQSDYTVTLPYNDVDGDKASTCSVNNPFGSKVDITSIPLCDCNALTGVCQTTVLLNDADFNSSTGSTIDLTYTVGSGIPLLTSAPGNIVITVTSVNDAPTILVGDTDNDGLEPVGGKLSLVSVDENTIVSLNNLGTSCSVAPYECNAGIYLDEGGGVYEDAQSLSLNIKYESITPIPAGGVSDLIEKVEVYYDGTLRGSFTDGATSDYISLFDPAAFDNDLLFVKIYPKTDQFGSFLFSFSVKDSEGLTASSPTLIEVEYKNITDNQPTVSAIADIEANEADVKYSSEFVIDEGGGISEDFQNIYFEIQSSNTSLIPVNSIKAYKKYDDGVNSSASFEAITGVNAILSGDGLTMRFNVVADYTDPFGTVMPNNEHYKIKLKLDSVDGVAGSSTITVTGNDYTSSSDAKTFAFTVNPVGANHGGWKKIQVNGERKDRFEQLVTGYETPKVELAWENFNTAGSAGNNDHNISGWRVYRREIGTEYDFDVPINTTDLGANDREFSDTTAVADKVYFYVVRPVDSTDTPFTNSNTGLSIPTKEIFSEVRVYVPTKGYNFIHRWMINREVCTKMRMDETNADITRRYDPLNNYRCPYAGPGETIVGASSYYDIGKDLVVDQIEAGCPYSVAPSCGSNGCIGIGTPSAALTDGSGKVYYNRTDGICYQDTGVWTEMNSIAGALTSVVADQSNNAFLPPLVNISQVSANNFCSVRSDLNSASFAAVESFLLPSRKEQIAYSSWSDSLLHSAIPPIELGLYLNSTSGCNSKNASGLETAFSDVDTPSTSYLYSVTGTKSSAIRSIYTGSQEIAGVMLTESCKSRYGLQDIYGNVSEWTRDRFSCHATDNTCEAVGTIDSAGAITGNYYQTTDSYFDNYTMDSLKGPCAEGLIIDNVCDEPMTNWAIDTKANRDGYFLFPVGMTVTNYFTENYDFSTVQDSLLPIGSSEGIATELLHDDGLTINSYLISKSPGGLAGLATSGSYKSAEYSGRYSAEFIPTQPVPALASNSTVGSNMNISLFQDNQRHLYGADISGDNSLYIIGKSYATGTYPTFVTVVGAVAPAAAVAVSYASGTNTFTITADAAASNADVAAALLADGDFNSNYTTFTAIASDPYVLTAADVTAEIVVSLLYNPQYGNDFDLDIDAGNVGSSFLPSMDSDSHLSSLSVSLTTGMTVLDFATYIHGQYGIGAVTGALAPLIEMVDIGSTSFTPNIVYNTPLADAARAISISYTHSAVGPYGATLAGLSLDVVIDATVTTVGELCTYLAAVSADVSVICNTSSTIPVVPLASYGLASTSIVPIMNIAAINQSSPVTVLFVSGAASGITVDSVANTLTITVASYTRVHEIVNLIAASAPATALVSATQLLNSDLYGFRAKTGTTSAGDVQIAANASGVSGNTLYISYVGTGTAGSETLTIDGSHIMIAIEAGATTATSIVNLINTHPIASNMVVASTTDGDRLQGILNITQLQNGVDSTDNKRVDVGFRCVAPINPATYDMAPDVDADGISIHPYQSLY